MGFVRQEHMKVRRVDMTGGFSNDPDWVADFDAAGARAAGSVTMVPKLTGVLELIYGFEDLAGEHIASDPPTRLDLHVLILGSGDEEGAGSKAIYELEECANLNSLSICQLVRPLVGTSYVTIRVKGLVSPPASAAYITIAGRVG